MFDTHCHLNFKAFDDTVDAVVINAQRVGVTHITIPGTDAVSSKKAIAIAQQYAHMYAAVGIHPHHVYEVLQSKTIDITNAVSAIETMLTEDKVVAIGEIGIDRHMYQKTKYGEYEVNEAFVKLQKEFFVAQLQLAIQYKKSVIIHNREAKQDLLPLLYEHWDSFFETRMVLHCCEPDKQLLTFVKEKNIFWGVDGDVTYFKQKAEFLPRVPLAQLVLETDSPFLIPEPYKTQKGYPNVPAHIPIIAEYVAGLYEVDSDVVKKQTFENGKRLFGVN